MAICAWGFALACSGGGPVGFVPGGVFASPAEAVTHEMDWTFATDLDSVDVQVGGAAPRTVRTGFVVLDGRPFLPVTGAPFKRWPESIREDPLVVLRADGRFFALQATPVEDPEEVARLRRVGQAKYGAPFHAKVLAGWTDYVRLSPRRGEVTPREAGGDPEP